MSENLIDRLPIGLRPTPRRAVVRRLGIGVGAGAAVSAGLIVVTLGPRPDMARAVGEGMFWAKLGYTLALAVLALWACERLARPIGVAQGRYAWLPAPVLALSALAGWQLASAPPAMRMVLMMGHTARICPWLILAFSIPPLLGLVWAMRGLAPTRLRLTGAMVGLAAGGAGASAYAIHCNEMAAPFLLVWYTLGVTGIAALGWIAGPRILRW